MAVPLSQEEVLSLEQLLFPPDLTEEDILRWKGQGFVFNDPASSTNFGLIQQFGGPCGVLASLQGFLIGRILFEGECKTDSQDLISKLQLVTEEEQYLTLSHVMANRLCVIGEDIKRVALVLQGETEGEFQVLWLGNDIQTVEQAVFQHRNHYSGPNGVLLFVFSAILTRGIEQIRQDSDDVDVKLTGMFGHCGQEIINLIITGRATSNVFDGEKPMLEGAESELDNLSLKGVASRPQIGYLSQLEAFRYCVVGDYFKNPLWPIWVVGSQSHFTILFTSQLEVLERNFAEVLLEKARVKFRAKDMAEAGFLDPLTIPDVIREIDVEGLQTDTAIEEFMKKLDVSTGVILWSDFWQALFDHSIAPSLPREVPSTNTDEESVKNQVKLAFDAVDTARNGFIESTEEILQTLLDRLSSYPVVHDSLQLSQYNTSEQKRSLNNKLVMDGTNIILWDNMEAWVNERLESRAESEREPLEKRIRSDSEVARELDRMLNHGGSCARESASRETQNRGVELSRNFSVYFYNGLLKSSSYSQSQLSKANVAVTTVITAQDTLNSIPAIHHEMCATIDQILLTRWPDARIEWDGEPPSVD